MPDDLIKKSIRLPADLDAYVDQQKGTTWTDKLCRILEDYRSGKKPGRNAWHITKTGSRPARRRSMNRTGRSTPLPGLWITCTALWTTLTTCLSRNPGGCLSSGSWNTGTAALAVRICRESRFTDSLPPTLPRQGNRSRPCCCFPAPSRQ